MSDVVVVGAGVAGLTAAVRLADRGFRVQVLERRAVAGGRAYSYRSPRSEHAVDNGQHVLMGCYRKTLALLDRLGTRGGVETQRSLAVPLAHPTRGTTSFRCARAPSPLHLTLGVLGYRHLGFRDRVRLFGGALALVLRHRRRDPALAAATVDEALHSVGQSLDSRLAFWNPLAIAVLNELPARASASLFAEVLSRVFFARAAASAIVFPRVGLSELYADAAVRAIESRGGRVECGRSVTSLEVRAERAVEIRLADGEIAGAKAFVLAVPPPALAAILPPPLRKRPPLARLAELRPSPIVSIHLWFAEALRAPRMLGFLDGPLHWLFTPSMQPPSGRYVTLVASGAHALVSAVPDDLVELARAELGRYLPETSSASLVDALVTKERAATWASTPAEQACRPPTATPIENLFLAGDWVDTALPGTIESAVESGERAAAAVAESLRPGARVERPGQVAACL